MDENQFRILLKVLEHIELAMHRMAIAAEAQVAETKAMRQMVNDRHEEEIRKEWNS